MYEIRTSNGDPVYYQNDADYVAYNIECSTAIGDAGYLKFTIPKTNPAYGTLVTRKSVLEMTIDGESLGLYEVREIGHDMSFNETVYAIGELAWLYDSVQPQAEFHDITPRSFLESLIRVHNAQCPDHQFRVGAVDVVDSNDSLYRYTNYETTLDDIRDKLVDRLGGQIKLRHANGVRYIDYLTDDTYGSDSTQRIYFGENLMDYSDSFTVDDICSEVVPLGATLENDSGDNSKIGNLEKRLDVTTVNDGNDWVSNQALVNRFGHIRVAHVWDDVTVPENLLAKARDWLASEQFEKMHLTVKAVDLSLTSSQFGRLRSGDTVQVIAEPYGLNRRFPITCRTYHPDDPSSDTLELGDDIPISFIDAQNAANKANANKTDEVDYQQTQWLTEAIENVTAMMTGDRGSYKLTEYDDDGRWLADYILDSPDKSKAKVVRKVNMNGTAYSTKGIGGPYETAIMADGIILGKYIQAHSVTAEQISQDYTKTWEDADTKTLTTARSEFKAADNKISATVTANKKDADGKITALQSRVTVTEQGIESSVKKGEINSSIKQSAEKIYIESNKFGWKSTNSSLTTDGTLTAKNAKFTNCNVDGSFRTESNNYATTVNGGSISTYAYNTSKKKFEQVGIISSNTYTTYGKESAPAVNIDVLERKFGSLYWHAELSLSAVYVSIGILSRPGSSKGCHIDMDKGGNMTISATETLTISANKINSGPGKGKRFNIDGEVYITGNLYVNGKKIG